MNAATGKLAYPCQTNVVIRDLKDPSASVIYSDFLDKVTAVKHSPNGNYIASGDEKGKLRIWSYNSDSKEFIIKKEHNLLSGSIHDVTWTEDNQRVAVSGEGKD